MNEFMFSKKSLSKFIGVKIKLIVLMSYSLATSPIDFAITEGKRSKKRQKNLFEKGLSKVEISKHEFGMAVDIVAEPYDYEKECIENTKIVIRHIEKCAKKLGIKIRLGLDFKNFNDIWHIELV